MIEFVSGHLFWPREIFLKRIFILSLFFSMAFAQEISIWTSFDGLELDWLKSQTKLYSDLFKVEVEIENFSIGEINQKMLLSKKDDDIELADIIVGLSQREIPKLNEEDLLANMQAFTTQEYLDDLSKNAREAFSIDDKLFGFPLYLEGPALIINTDLVEISPKSFEDIVKISKDLEQKEIIAFRFDISNLYFAYPFLTAYGGKLFTNDELSIETKNFIKGAEFLRDLKFKYKLFSSTSDYQEALENFYYSKQAMVYDGPWALKTYQQAKLNMKVIPLPATKAGLELNGLSSAYGLVLTKSAEADINSINLAKWLSRTEAQVALSNMTDKVPSSLKAIDNLDNELIIGFARALSKADIIPTDAKMDSSWGPISDALFKILVDKNSNIKGILKQAVQDIIQSQ